MYIFQKSNDDIYVQYGIVGTDLFQSWEDQKAYCWH
jgi:hypothetical protein